MLQRDPTLRMRPEEYLPSGLDEEVVYALILPILQAGDGQHFQIALRAYSALPAGSMASLANRAAVLQQIGDIPGALDFSGRALALAPDDPGVLNNHCYILFSAQRPSDALPFCERAVAAAPDIAAVHDSLSDVFAALGRCQEAEREIQEARRLDPTYADYRQTIVCHVR